MFLIFYLTCSCGYLEFIGSRAIKENENSSPIHYTHKIILCILGSLLAPLYVYTINYLIKEKGTAYEDWPITATSYVAIADGVNQACSSTLAFAY